MTLPPKVNGHAMLSLVLTQGDIHPELAEPHWQFGTPPPFAAAFICDGHGALGACRLYRRKLVAEGTALNVMGVGGVYVVPAHRGEHVGTTMMTLLARRVRGDAMAPALVLRARKHGDFYRRLGYVELAEALWALPVVDGLTLEPGAWSVTPDGWF